MCGFVLLTGSSGPELISEYLAKLQHRGPDHTTTYCGNNIRIGFQRLAINGNSEEGQQPYKDRDWLAVTNGEIYNFAELIAQYQLAESGCDTAVILPLFLRLKNNIIDILDGFYSSVLINPEQTEAICLRDFMGKKPLFVGASDGKIFLTSELKAIPTIEWFRAIPKGVSSVDLKTGSIKVLRHHQQIAASGSIVKALTEGVQKRMVNNAQPVGIFLSGGLDSSLVASIARRLREDIIYFVLGNDSGPDATAAERVIDYLQLENVIRVPLPEDNELPQLISNIVYATESYNPSIVSNGLATYMLAKAARKQGIKVVLSGEGADELFGGYHHFDENDHWRETRRKLINDMAFTELRRLDLSCMANAIEPRCPFLDRKVIAISEQMRFDQLYSTEHNKFVLRSQFSEYLPEEILYRKKTSCDVGSGIRGLIVRHLRKSGRSEREELLDIWKKHFKYESSNQYFHEYPVFDKLIDVRGTAHR